jgi:hypothetical protein
MSKNLILKEDIMPMSEYVKIRKERRSAMTDLKRNRRVNCGPDATFYFENYATMWHQIHEMLYIEKGGDAQINDELTAYNPLIPDGNELVATLMFEIDDPIRRAQVLGSLGGVEETIAIEFDDCIIRGCPETDVDRTSAAGKASSVQFIHFPFGKEEVVKFKAENTQPKIRIGHIQYTHSENFSDNLHSSLISDLD